MTATPWSTMKSASFTTSSTATRRRKNTSPRPSASATIPPIRLPTRLSCWTQPIATGNSTIWTRQFKPMKSAWQSTRRAARRSCLSASPTIYYSISKRPYTTITRLISWTMRIVWSELWSLRPSLTSITRLFAPLKRPTWPLCRQMLTFEIKFILIE